jgi:serine O-acetyltransferase
MERRARQRNPVRVLRPGVQLAAQDRPRFPVARVDEQRVPEGGEMDAHLVRSPGERLARAPRHVPEPFHRREVGTRPLRSGVSRIGDAHLPAATLDERPLAPGRYFEVAAHQRQVGLFRSTGLERLVQCAMCLASQCEEDDPARIAIEAMDGKRALCNRLHLLRQRFACVFPAPWDGQHSGRLVERQHDFIPIEHAHLPRASHPRTAAVQRQRYRTSNNGRLVGRLSIGERMRRAQFGSGRDGFVHLLDELWRDLDRMSRSGVRPLNIFTELATWVAISYRVGRALRALPSVFRVPAICAHKPIELLLGTLSGIALPAEAEIGGGLRLGSVGGIRVAPEAYIGRDCELSEGVTISSAGGTPWIGDRVLIGPGAKLAGPIRIGNDAVIGPNAVVESDVPDGVTVAGVPARVVASVGSRGKLVAGRKRPPLLDAVRGLVRGFLPRPTQLLLRD